MTPYWSQVKHMDSPFDAPGKIRMVCDVTMSIYILALLHVTSCHPGMNTLNHLFRNTYKCIEANVAGLVKLVCTGCRACRFHQPINKKVIPEGRIPLPTEPMDTCMIDFMVFKKELIFKGRDYQQPPTSWTFIQTFSSHSWCLIRQLKPSLTV